MNLLLTSPPSFVSHSRQSVPYQTAKQLNFQQSSKPALLFAAAGDDGSTSSSRLSHFPWLSIFQSPSQSKLSKKIAQDLPYDTSLPQAEEREDLLHGKKLVNPSLNVHHQVAPVIPVTVPSLQEIQSLSEKDPPKVLVVPGKPAKKIASDDSVLVHDATPNVNQTQDTDFTYDFNVKWSKKKCVRDLFQNFADSQGQTLSGTQLTTSRASDGTYTVRIRGDADYHHEFVRNFISSKGDDSDAAGGFGEGTKIMALSLLKEHGVDSVTFSSRNWALEYSSVPRTIADKATHVMVRKLSKISDQKGNYVEVKTKDPELVSEIYQGLDLFHHPGNQDFYSSTSENAVGGFRYLGLDEGGKARRGNIYPARQRFEYKDPEQWDKNVEFLTLWTNSNVLKDLGVVDRDRLAIQPKQVKVLAKAIAEEMSNQELMDAIFSLQDIWEDDNVLKAMELDPERYTFDHAKALDESAGRILLQELVNEASSLSGWDVENGYKRKLGTHFPDKYVYYTGQLSENLLSDMKAKGYKFCPSYFSRIGMISDVEKSKEISRHRALPPTKQEIQQINILKEAAGVFAKYPKVGKLVTKADIDKPIFVFNNVAKEETVDTLAEYAKTHIWFDRAYLQRATFDHALGTYWHELLHKTGGDSNPNFGYALTDMLSGHLDLMLNMKSKDKKQFKRLQALWNATNNTTQSSQLDKMA